MPDNDEIIAAYIREKMPEILDTLSFIATCNDLTGKDMTATFWTLMEVEP